MSTKLLYMTQGDLHIWFHPCKIATQKLPCNFHWPLLFAHVVTRVCSWRKQTGQICLDWSWGICPVLLLRTDGCFRPGAWTEDRLPGKKGPIRFNMMISISFYLHLDFQFSAYLWTAGRFQLLPHIALLTWSNWIFRSDDLIVVESALNPCEKGKLTKETACLLCCVQDSREG